MIWATFVTVNVLNRMKYRKNPEVYTKEIAKICIKKSSSSKQKIFDEKSVFFFLKSEMSEKKTPTI